MATISRARAKRTAGRGTTGETPSEATSRPAVGGALTADGQPAPLPTSLVVDDDPAIRSILREMLELEGFAVQTAEHGGPALNILRTSTARMVVLLGLVMPYVDGEAVLEALAADKRLASRHAVLMVTGSVHRATTGRVAELREHLGVPLLCKPSTFEQLMPAVEEAVRRLASDANARSRR